MTMMSTMSTVKPLEPAALRRRCDVSLFRFETTDALEDFPAVFGQPRAVEALRFGVGIRQPGFNLFVFGPPEAGMHAVVRAFLDTRAAGEPTPSDWVYVHNFEQPHRPQAIRLEPGRGRALRSDMEHLVEALHTALRATFNAEEYRARIQAIEDEVRERQQKALEDLEQRARTRGFALVRTPLGMGFAPMRGDEVLDPEEFAKWPADERDRVAKEITAIQEELQAIVAQFPHWQREAREKVKALSREFATHAVGELISELRVKYGDAPQVVAYLDQVREDVIANVDLFRRDEDQQHPLQRMMAQQAAAEHGALRKYEVNVLVDHGAASRGAPVVYEANPSYPNLVGRIEHLSAFGALVTDFTLIKPGALHRANGGYLVFDARKMLMHPYAWEGLKEALRAGEIRIESLGQIFSVVSTVSLEPEPIPLDVKVVLVGEPLLYYLFHAYDPDFGKLFKVAVEFDDRMPRTPETSLLYARFIATQARAQRLRPLDRDAVALVIEQSARVTGDAERVSTLTRGVSTLLSEADYWAGQREAAVTTAADVQAAIDAAVRRADRVRERLLEETQRGTIMIDTDGARVGQVNGLSVLQLGELSFGRPSRITARVRVGRGEVIDIEREVELGGPIHSKGVLILSNFLAARYAADEPLSLSASLAFEQSYSGIEGDSASSAELYALLSALAEVPIRQDLAVTGSVNQHGEVQAIGGVNEKIEGFFDLCHARGLTGTQGVLVPAANTKHLMLRPDVVAAAAAGRFAVYAVSSVDQGIEILTGVAAGEADARGVYPEGTINRRVADRLRALAERRRAFGEPPKNR
jgi:lon-related putative ATP-dependent protease